jgi:hypothetical protein
MFSTDELDDRPAVQATYIVAFGRHMPSFVTRGAGLERKPFSFQYRIDSTKIRTVILHAKKTSTRGREIMGHAGFIR